MQRKAFKAIGLMVFLGLSAIALPSRGQDLNAELNYAICNQNWDEAIAIIDLAREMSPESEEQLEIYRDRLMELQNSAARLPEWGKECTIPPSLIPVQPATIANDSNGGEPETMVAFLDRLKECQRDRYGEGSSLVIEIGGQNQERCAMRYIYGDGSQLQCMLSPEGVASLTNENAYENARIMDEFQQTGNLDSRDFVENPDADILDKECRYIEPPKGI